MQATSTRFLEAIHQSWDSIEPWQQTVDLGFSQSDREALLELCEDTDDVGKVFAEVMDAIVEHVRVSGGRVPNQDIWTNLNQEELK